jgi:hypothetical protein
MNLQRLRINIFALAARLPTMLPQREYLDLMLSGIFLGTLLRRGLPEHHLDEHAKDVVRLGVGLIATIAALVLGLLIAAAKSSFDTQTSQVRQITADLILLDNILAQYGPEARPRLVFSVRASPGVELTPVAAGRLLDRAGFLVGDGAAAANSVEFVEKLILFHRARHRIDRAVGIALLRTRGSCNGDDQRERQGTDDETGRAVSFGMFAAPYVGRPTPARLLL